VSEYRTAHDLAVLTEGTQALRSKTESARFFEWMPWANTTAIEVFLFICTR